MLPFFPPSFSTFKPINISNQEMGTEKRVCIPAIREREKENLPLVEKKRKEKFFFFLVSSYRG